jgi:hypothetical protein
MKKLITVIFVFLLSACATTHYVFLIEPNKQVLEKPNFIPSGEAKFNFDSAKSIKENSIVEIGGWHIIFGKNKQAFRFDIKITNNSYDIVKTPDDIIIIDADKNSLRILRPDEYVYYSEGMTSEEALSQSSAISIYASQLQKTHGYSGTIYTYGTIYNNYYSGFSTYSAYPIQSPASSFASGFARGFALGLAARAARISRDVRECQLTALKPILTLPHGRNIGRIWSLAGKLPIEIHIFTLGDHHIIKLGQIQNKK